jgi:2-methylcitrate dehydratase PrpD
MTTSTVLRQFADYAVSQRTTAAPHGATRAVVDWFAATIPGSAFDAPRILVDALVDADETGRSTLVPGGRRVKPRTAALINGTAAHTAELDDIFRDGIYHPGAPTIAAVLALCEHVGGSGPDLLRAVTVGYEVGNRIAAAVNPAHYRFWHTTGTVGVLGAAGAAAELLRLDAEKFTHALATATTMAAGLQQAFRSDAMSKPLHSGHAAEAGLLAAMLAARGFTGAPDVLEGKAGFGAAMAQAPDWGRATAGLGTDEPTVNQVTVKNHSCCGHTFAALDAAVQLRDGVDVENVDRVDVATYGTAIEVAGNPDPRSEFEAKFSIAFTVASALIDGPVRLRAFTPDRLHDPVVRALAAKVRLHVDPTMDAAFPGRRAARVTVVSSIGGQVRAVERSTRKGDPDDPLTDAELAAKFAEYATPTLGPDATAALAGALWQLPTAATVALPTNAGVHA